MTAHADEGESMARLGVSNRLVAALLLLGGVLVSALAARPGAASPDENTGGERVIQVISANVGGKNLFIPGTIVVETGEPHTLSIYNTTDVPHGFKIDALGIETVLPAGEEHVVKLPAIDDQQIYPIRCHLHPAHRGATLVVLED